MQIISLSFFLITLSLFLNSAHAADPCSGTGVTYDSTNKTCKYTYVGVTQSFVAPTYADSITVKVWGAGGGIYGTNGGAGGFSKSTFPIGGGDTLTITVGEGGNGAGSATFGGGGAGIAPSAAGGGRSEVKNGSTVLIVAGGGGGGGSDAGCGGTGGGANASGTSGWGRNGNFDISEGGGGGTTSGPGSAGNGGGQAGSGNNGGNVSNSGTGGAGGGGYYGGGSGGVTPGSTRGAGGGGSGYVHSSGSSVSGETQSRCSTLAAGDDDSDYSAGLGTPGNHGYVVISWTGTDPSDPCTTGGQIRYESGEMQFCNGTEWRSMKGTVGSSCSTAGTQTYNSTTNIMEFCDGTNWYSMKASSSAIESCTSAQEGHQRYTSNDMQFCEGANWYSMDMDGGSSGSSARYWRIRSTVDTSNWWRVIELEFFPSSVSGTKHTVSTALSSGDISANESKDNAFDGNLQVACNSVNNEYWGADSASAGEWIGADLGSSQVVNSFRLITYCSGPTPYGHHASSIVLEYSNDASNWTSAGSFSLSNTEAMNTWQNFTVNP